MGFFRERYKQMMLRSGYETDLVEAILSVDFSHVCRLRSRIDQLKRFSEEAEEFEALALTFKRVTNILKNQNESYAVDPAFFREPCEGRLWETVQGLRGDILESLDQRDYLKALQLMIRFRKPVDEFFDGAEILTKEDPKLKDNRVGVLQHVAGLFLKVADLSKFSI
jgi:glycyl-tRNA synthetase beta chain